MKVLVQFSAGKDSQASLIWAAKKYGVDKIEAVFCDTKWESPETYRHELEICEKMGVKNVILKNNQYPRGMIDLVIRKKRFPSAGARFCTEELKTKPMIDYVLSHNEHLIIIQGIRSDESDSRAKMSEQCSYFKYYYAPYMSNSIIVSQLSAKIKLTERQKKKLKKAKDRLEKGQEDYKYHTYRKKEVLEWRSKYSDDVLRPCFNWSAQETIDYIIQAGQKPNPLYYMGMSRVGCFPCVMCKLSEIKQIANRFPERIKQISEFEKETGSTIFTVGKIPERFCSKTSVSKKTGKVSKYPTIDDVVKYAQGNEAQNDLFEEPNASHSCMSFYGICE